MIRLTMTLSEIGQVTIEADDPTQVRQWMQEMRELDHEWSAAAGGGGEMGTSAPSGEAEATPESASTDAEESSDLAGQQEEPRVTIDDLRPALREIPRERAQELVAKYSKKGAKVALTNVPEDAYGDLWQELKEGE